MSITYANDLNFEQEVYQSDLPVLVDFYADWCGPCKKMDPTIKELADQYQDQVKVVKVDIEQAPNTINEFGIRSVPTFAYVKNGGVEDIITSSVPKSSLEEMLGLT